MRGRERGRDLFIILERKSRQGLRYQPNVAHIKITRTAGACTKTDLRKIVAFFIYNLLLDQSFPDKNIAMSAIIMELRASEDIGESIFTDITLFST